MTLIMAQRGVAPDVVGVWIDTELNAAEYLVEKGLPLNNQSDLQPIALINLLNELSKANLLLLDIKPDNLVMSGRKDSNGRVMAIDIDPMFSTFMFKQPELNSANRDEPFDPGQPSHQCLLQIHLVLLLSFDHCQAEQARTGAKKFTQEFTLKERTELKECLNRSMDRAASEDSLCNMLTKDDIPGASKRSDTLFENPPGEIAKSVLFMLHHYQNKFLEGPDERGAYERCALLLGADCSKQKRNKDSTGGKRKCRESESEWEYFLRILGDAGTLTCANRATGSIEPKPKD